MASLRHLPNSPNWIACFTLPDGRRTQRSTGTPDKREAQRIANSFEDASREGRRGRFTEFQARKVIAEIYAISNRDQLASSTIEDFFKAWLKRKEIEATQKTHERYRTAINHVLGFLGAKVHNDITHLSSKEITLFRDSLAEKLSAASVNTTLKILRTALSQAKREGVVDTNEAERVALLKVAAGENARRPFTMDELKLILKTANEQWRGMILVGLYTGLRLSDIAGLTWLNIDLANAGVNVVTGKTGRRQILPLAKPVMRYLEQLPSSDDPSAPLFPDAYKARRRNQNTGMLSNQFYEILTAAGLVKKRMHRSINKGRNSRREMSEITFHSLRHTATSLLKNAGVSDVVAMDIIGHESEAISRNYTHIDMSTKRKAVESMPDVLED
jgi:integrase